MNNQQQIDLNTLTVEQLEQLLGNLTSAIGQLELQKQMHVQTYVQVNTHYLNEKAKQAKQMPIKMPTLKKITLPKKEEATYTPNNSSTVTSI